MRKVEPSTLIFAQDQSNLTFVLFTMALPPASLEGYTYSKEAEQKVVIPWSGKRMNTQSHEKESSEQFAGISSLYFIERDTVTYSMHTAHSSGAQVLTPSHFPISNPTARTLHLASKQLWREGLT